MKMQQTWAQRSAWEAGDGKRTFDWDAYQRDCDIAEYWGMDEDEDLEWYERV